MLLSYIENIKISMFFDFLNEYTYIYRSSIKEGVIGFIRVLVARAKNEQDSLFGSDIKSNHVINQWWNVLRSICECKDYIPEYLDQIEEEMKPIFEFMTQPDKIDFDDDVSLLISTSIALSKRITDTQKAIFPWFQVIHEKYKGIFGNLLVWLNNFIVYNDGWLGENPAAVTSLNQMATTSLFYSQKKTFSWTTNCDGAILLQLCLQYLKSPVFDDYFADSLSNTVKILKEKKDSEALRTVLMGNFLSAFIYSPEATFKYLEAEQILEPVFEELFTQDKKMFHEYQRKLYLIGFGQLLFSEYMPDFITSNISKLISKMILMLGRLNLAEKYKTQKLEIQEKQDEPNRKNMHIFDCPTDNEDEKIEDELKEINDFYDKESSSSLLSAETGTNGGPFTITRKEEDEKKMDDNSDKDDLNDSLIDSEDYDDEEMENERLELEMEYDMLNSKVKDTDENEYFKKVMISLYQNNTEHMKGIINELSEKQQNFMKQLLQTQLVNIDEDGQNKAVHRRIIKACRRK